MSHVLIVDDERDLAELIHFNLFYVEGKEVALTALEFRLLE